MKPHTRSKVKTDFQVFVKPVGDACNMACSYCYYSKSDEGPDRVRAMPDDPCPLPCNGHANEYGLGSFFFLSFGEMVMIALLVCACQLYVIT